MTDVLTKDKKYTFDLTYMFTDNLGGIEIPHLQNIKIEENPKLFAIYAILVNKIKTIQVFVYYLMQKVSSICLLLFTCSCVVSFPRGFLFLWVLGMNCVILLWHSLLHKAKCVKCRVKICHLNTCTRFHSIII